MAGHNKWSKVKHTKGALDAKRGKLFTKLIKEITVASKLGGGQPDGNPRLRSAIQAAKDASMPKDNIDRAIKKGTGELQGETFEECLYEGYGPSGVAILVEAATDNRNRTVSDLRKMFKTSGGNLGESGSVAWMFEPCGQITFDKEGKTEDQLMEIALEAGANDVKTHEGYFEVITDSKSVYQVKETFDKLGILSDTASLGYQAKNTVSVEDREALESLFVLLEKIEDHDDVQKVHANFEAPEALIKELHESDS